ncbi:MAG: hypothetical protein ACRDKT_04325 [Actinomycetota bacterium]
MKVEIYNGYFLGSAEWRGPNDVEVEMEDAEAKSWFERYFSSEDASLGGSVDCPTLVFARRDESEEAFTRAAQDLRMHDYRAFEPGHGPETRSHT